jgi:hypothetical protein
VGERHATSVALGTVPEHIRHRWCAPASKRQVNPKLPVVGVACSGVFEGVDDIDWGNLSAWGDPATVPALLRAVAVAPREEADRLCRDLDDVLTHQGEPSDCAVHAVPFIVDLAEAPTASRGWALGWLRHAALPWDYVEVFGLHWLDDWGFADDGLGPASRWLAEGGLWHRGISSDALDERCYRAVAAQRQRIAALVDDDDPYLRIGSAQVLAALGLEAEELLPRLWSRVGIDADPVVRAHLWVCIGELGLCVAEERKAALADRLLAAADADTEEVVRLLAWTAAALVSPDTVPSSLHARFLDTWDRAGEGWRAARRGALWPYPLPELWSAWARVHDPTT